MSDTPGNTNHTVVLYDGDCGMCHRSVRFILARERDAVLKFASLDSGYAVKALAAHGLAAPPPETLVVMDGDRMLVRSDAALFIAGHMKAPWRWLRIFRLLPRGLRDAIYDFVARRRHRWFDRPDTACPMPDAAMRERFLS